MNFSEHIEAALGGIAYSATPEGLYEPIAYVLSGGGKRLRPTLLLMAYNLFRDDWQQAMPAAIGIETYHNHTLLHDDLMDRADMRRGRPTVHRQWDENTAVLSGDTMLILAFRHFMACTSRRTTDVLDLFARSAQEICEGQQMDVNFERRTDVSEAEYIEMIRLKTSVLLACSAKAGALLADAPDADADALYAFAERLGLAFQLQDDYLDVYGDPAVFGKKIGGDILCGKKTFLLINALNRSDDAGRRELTGWIADSTMPAEEKIRRVTGRYDALGIPDVTLRAISRFYDEARAELQRVGLPAERTQPLWEYAQSLLGRKS